MKSSPASSLFTHENNFQCFQPAFSLLFTDASKVFQLPIVQYSISSMVCSQDDTWSSWTSRSSRDTLKKKINRAQEEAVVSFAAVCTQQLCCCVECICSPLMPLRTQLTMF